MGGSETALGRYAEKLLFYLYFPVGEIYGYSGASIFIQSNLFGFFIEMYSVSPFVGAEGKGLFRHCGKRMKSRIQERRPS